MPLPYAKPTWVDGPYKAAPYDPVTSKYGTGIPVSLPVFSNPIPGINAPYVLKQDFQHFLDGWQPLALNTPHGVADFADYLLVEESEKQDIGGGVIKWTRTYAKVPEGYVDWENKSYSFIGFTNTTSITAPFIPNRGRVARQILAMVEYDYCLCPGDGVGVTFHDPTWGDYTVDEPGDIKKIWAMQYCYQYQFASGGVIGGISYATDALTDGSSASESTPTLQQYWNTILPDAYQNKWGGTKTKQVILEDSTFAGAYPNYTGHFAGTVDLARSGYGGIIPAEDSTVRRFMGNIYLRVTPWILAQ